MGCCGGHSQKTEEQKAEGCCGGQGHTHHEHAQDTAPKTASSQKWWQRLFSPKKECCGGKSSCH